jgi:GTP-binding protein LepA
MATKADLKPVEIGIFFSGDETRTATDCGGRGIYRYGIETVKECRVGDTITSA